MRLLLSALLLAIALVVSASAQSDPIPVTLSQLGQLNTVQAAIEAADGNLVDRLNTQGPFTVFAPTDTAFYNMGREEFMRTVGNPSLITRIILYHIVPGLYPLNSLYDGQLLTTLEGESLRISRNGSNVYVNNILISSGDHLASNGIIHLIDGVLLPPSIAPPQGLNIPRLAVQLGLNSFSSALFVADYGITQILNGKGPFTVFAPSDAAFSALPASTLHALRNNPLDLRRVLLFHVAPGFFPSSTLYNGRTLATLDREILTITRSAANTIMAGTGAIVSPDNRATNGLIHVIDRVQIPPSMQSTYPPV